MAAMDVDTPAEGGKKYKVWVPKQQYPAKLVDFRSDAMPNHIGPKGFTVKKQEERQQKGLLPVTTEDTEGLGHKIDLTRLLKNGETRNTIGVAKVSGKDWKSAQKPARALKSAGLRKPTLEEVKAEREFRRVAKEQRAEAKAKRNEILRAERERRKRVREEKEQRRKAAEITQRVSTATAKRMMKSKKARKMLRTADTDK